jgi:hypothetical protein
MKFKIDDKEYKLPEYISIEDYVKIYKIKDVFSDDYFAARLISQLTDAPIEELLETDYQQMNYLASYVMSLIPTQKPEFVDRFELDGVHYGFFPDWTQITFAEFVDMDTISTKKPDELLNMLHFLAAVMYRPIVEEKSKHDFKIEKYDVEKMKQRAELFKKKLDVKYILGAQFFFINFANKFSSYTQISLIPKLSIWKKIKLAWMMRKWIWAAIFNKPLDGSLSSTNFLKTILQNTNISLKER